MKETSGTPLLKTKNGSVAPNSGSATYSKQAGIAIDEGKTHLTVPSPFDIHDESSAMRSEFSSVVLEKGFKDPSKVVEGGSVYLDEAGGLEVPDSEFLTSDFETTINILNNIIGCGTLALPYCLAVCGLSAFVPYFGIGYICVYGAKLLAKLMYDENGNRVRFNMFDITNHAFGMLGSQLVRYLQIIQLICSAASFLILASQVATAFVKRNFPMFNTYDYDLYNTMVMFIGSIFFILSMFMARLKNLAILSIMGGINSLTCISCVCIDCFYFNTIQWDGFFDYPVYTDLHGLMICNGILLSSFMFHHQVTHHVAEMQNPEKAQGIMNLAGTVVVLGKLVMIVIAFATFMGDTEEIVILNLQSNTLRLVSSFCIIIDKLMTFPLYFYTIRMIPEGAIFQQYPKLRADGQAEIQFYISLPIRISIMGLIIATCVLFRHISTIMAFSSCIMIFFEVIIPCSCMLLRPDATWWDYIHCVLLVPLGILYFLVGTYVNFYYLFHPDA